MKICIDLDGTICPTKNETETYEELCPMPGAVETIAKWKSEGHYIVLQTARGMRSCSMNEGKILAKMGYLYRWLEKWNIVVDEIRIGKPDCDIFVDDKSYKHINWKDTAVRVHDLNKQFRKENT